MSEGFAARLHQRCASPHHEEPPQGGVSNGETRLAALLRMRRVGSGITDILILRSGPEYGEGPRLEGRTTAARDICSQPASLHRAVRRVDVGVVLEDRRARHLLQLVVIALDGFE